MARAAVNRLGPRTPPLGPWVTCIFHGDTKSRKSLAIALSLSGQTPLSFALLVLLAQRDKNKIRKPFRPYILLYTRKNISPSSRFPAFIKEKFVGERSWL